MIIPGYHQTISDTMIFMTQPFWLLVTWLSVDMKKLDPRDNISENQLLVPSGMNNFSTTQPLTGQEINLPLSPSQTEELQKLTATPIQSQV